MEDLSACSLLFVKPDYDSHNPKGPWFIFHAHALQWWDNSRLLFYQAAISSSAIYVHCIVSLNLILLTSFARILYLNQSRQYCSRYGIQQF